MNFSGKSAKDKISDLRGKLGQEKAFAIIVSTFGEVGFMCLHLLHCVLISVNSARFL